MIVVQELLSEMVSGQGHMPHASADSRLGLIVSILQTCFSAAADVRLTAVRCLLPSLFELAGHDMLPQKAWRSVCSAIMAFMMVCCAKR